MKKTIYFLSLTVIAVILIAGCTLAKSSSSGSSSTGGGGNGTKQIDYNVMVSIDGGTYYQTDGANGFNHTISSFQLGKYEVTYDLWYSVYQWAILPANGYNFANAGMEGSVGAIGVAPTSGSNQPVTIVSWRDVMVWCNAYSAKSGLVPCYTYSSAVIKDATNATACDNAVCTWTNSGYRLPTEGEWQYAASNKGTTPYNYLSGATADYTNDAASFAVAVFYHYNSGNLTGVIKTADVGTKAANALFIFDMSGNVFEWCWDWYASYPTTAQTDYRGPASGSTSTRVDRGGSWAGTVNLCQVSYRNDSNSNYAGYAVGFRVAKAN